MKHTLAFLLLSFYFIPVCAQETINGVLVDKHSRKPITDAHVSVSNMTAVSSVEGKFTFHNLKDDSIQLKISHVSYEDITVTLIVNHEAKIISLTPKVIELQEVVVRASKASIIKLGSSAKKPAIVYFGHVTDDIKVLKIKNENTNAGLYLNTLNYYFVQSKQTLGKGYNGASFLIKIYDCDDTTGLPGKELIIGGIKVVSKGRNKWMSVDISKFRIPLPAHDFFIGIQFTEERGFKTPSGMIQIEPCFGGTNEFGEEALCYTRHENKWYASAQNIMINVEAGEIDAK